MLDGLYGYEVVMLVLGALFFVLLAALLAVQIVRGKPYGSLLAFFLVPIIMMGYTRVKSVQYKDGVLSMELATEQLQANPTDPALRSALEQQVARWGSRPTSDPLGLTRIAKAQFALGNQDAAEATLARVLQVSPGFPQARQLEQRIQLGRDLASLTAQVAGGDTGAKQKLQETVNQTAGLKISNPTLLTHLAGAQAALGDRYQAMVLTDTALQIKPDLTAALQLKKRLEIVK